MHRLVSFLTLSSCLVYAHLALAGGKPPIYRCTVRGTPVFSDTPCQPGEEAAAGPLRFPGKSPEAPREFAATAGSAEPNGGPSRRSGLSGATQAECRLLDGRLKAFGERERAASRDEMPDLQGQFLRLRQRYRELGC